MKESILWGLMFKQNGPHTFREGDDMVEAGAETKNHNTRRRGSVGRLRDLRDAQARDIEEDERRD